MADAMIGRTSVGRVKTGMMAGVLALAAFRTAGAQAPEGGESTRAQQIQARFQILAMEGVLERAVQLGAQRVRAQVQAVAPDMLFITGGARARGFWLDGYGVFFDVDVPAMRRSLAWTFRMLEQSDRGLEVTLTALKRQIAAVDDPAARRDLQHTLERLEAHVSPAGVGAPGAPVRNVSRPDPGVAAAAAQPEDEAKTVLDDPGELYTTQVKSALVDAMIEYSAPLPLLPAEWLTVAARDQDGSRLQPGDPYEVSTILLRVRGADLAAFRGGQIDRDETRRRVEVKEY
jgi:hypothetical protein